MLAATAAVTAAALPASAAAQTPLEPFPCTTPSIYLAQGAPTQLNEVTYSAGSAVFTPVGPPVSPAYNAIGFNPVDDFAYAIANRRLIRIGADGSVHEIGDTGVQANAGAFSDDGTFYIGLSGSQVIYTVDLVTAAATPIGLSDPIPGPDFTWLDGKLWGDGGSGHLGRIDPQTGEVRQFAYSDAPAGITGGAAWTFGNGNLGIGDNTSGTLFQFQIDDPSSNAPTITLVSSAPGPPTGNNDATTCESKPVDLALTKSAPAKVTPDDQITWTLTVRNNGEGNSSGYTVSDTLPAGVTGIASTTPGCTVQDSTVTCVGDPIAVGEEDVITITGTAPGGAATLVNAATVTGNEHDPEPANDTGQATTLVVVPVGLCRGTPVRALGLMPATANPPEVPCRTEQKSVLRVSSRIGTQPVGGLLGSVLGAVSNVLVADAVEGSTKAGENAAQAESHVADATLSALGLVIRVQGAHSEVGTQLTDGCGGLEQTGRSSVATLTINGVKHVALDEPATIPLPGLGAVHLNQQVREGATITQRAVLVDLPGTDLDVALGESKAGIACP